MLREAIQCAVEGRHLSRAQAAAAVDAMLDGSAPASLIAALLVALRVKGETPDEIAGAAQALRARAARVNVPLDRLVDTCGTGGDGAHTFNISTAAAFVTAYMDCAPAPEPAEGDACQARPLKARARSAQRDARS